jgi:hypothetical protein
MKKWKITCLILIISLCTIGLFTAYGDKIENKLADWGYSLGSGMKNVSEKSNISEKRNVVSYINDIPVYEDEIIDRIENNKAISDSMKAAGSSTTPSWGSNPFDYVYREKFELYYAETNDIEVSKEELEECIAYERSIWESEDGKEIFEQYLAGRGITEEEFYNEIAPPSYEKTLLKRKVREHILQNADMNEKEYEEKQKYLDEFYQENIKVEEINKDFIKKYSE